VVYFAPWRSVMGVPGAFAGSAEGEILALSSRPVPVPDAAARDLVAQTIIFKQNRHPWFLKTKEKQLRFAPPPDVSVC